jgi:hypothetical protein
MEREEKLRIRSRITSVLGSTIMPHESPSGHSLQVTGGTTEPTHLYIIDFKPDRWPLGELYRFDGPNPPTFEQVRL